MLLNPIILTPLMSIAPYRELVFTMGSPIVFQTAPPHPASNALITCPPVLLGGPDASQKGFGLVTPANFTLRSAIVHLRFRTANSSAFKGHLHFLRGEPSHWSKPRAAAMPSATASTTSLPPF